MRHAQRGYTLIEIMIVLAILAIILVFAIPMYTDYSARAKVTECLGMQAPTKQRVSEFVISNERMPPPESVPLSRATEYCEPGSFTRESDDVLTLIVGIDEAAIGVNDPGALIEARLEGRRCANNDVEWSCFYASAGGDTTQGRYLPASCRTTLVTFSDDCPM